MSEAAVMEFLKSSLKNPALFSEITSSTEGRSEVQAGEAVAALGARQGFQFSGEEALVVRERFLDRLNDSEGDEVLQGVSGGSQVGDVSRTQVDILSDVLGGVGPAGTGVMVDLIGGTIINAAEGQSGKDALGNAAVDTAQKMDETKDKVQEFFKSVFSGW
jgi:hypothetical protein